jgi:hypothetical protein
LVVSGFGLWFFGFGLVFLWLVFGNLGLVARARIRLPFSGADAGGWLVLVRGWFWFWFWFLVGFWLVVGWLILWGWE